MKNYYIFLIKFLKKHFALSVIILLVYILVYIMQPMELMLTQKLVLNVTDKQNLMIITLNVIGIIIIYTLNNIYTSISSILKTKIQFYIAQDIYKKLFEAIYNINIINLDHSDFLLKIKRARIAIDEKMISCITGIAEISGIAISLISTCLLVAHVDDLYIILFLLSWALQNIYISKIVRANIYIEKKINIAERKHDYINSLVLDRNSVKEIRSYRLYDWLEKKRNYTFSNMKKEHMTFLKRWTVKNVLWSSIMYLFEGIIFGGLLYQFNHNSIGIVDVILIVQSQKTFFSLATSLTNTVAALVQNSPYIKEYDCIISEMHNNRAEYMSIEKDNGKAIILKNIGFRYKSNEILHDINLEINKGEVIALVGENGSGKSTLIKIVCGLLKPNNGSLSINSNNISAVFQDYAKFNLTIRENIGYGEASAIDNSDKLEDIIRQSGCEAILEKSKYKLETILGKEFSDKGMDVSEGEWQKIAVGRALFKNAEIIIFDEPAASLDPLAEKEQFLRIKNMFIDKTVIIVSHRIGLAKLANRIICLCDGKIVEEGTHNELYRQRGYYYDYYESQAKWYK